jgi:hypothetical protein
MPSQPSAFSDGGSDGQPVTVSRLKRLARVFTAAGDIRPTVADYQLALGTLNANAPGSKLDGRREINWDAVPAAFTNTNTFPGDFFNQPVVGRARGVGSRPRDRIPHERQQLHGPESRLRARVQLLQPDSHLRRGRQQRDGGRLLRARLDRGGHVDRVRRRVLGRRLRGFRLDPTLRCRRQVWGGMRRRRRRWAFVRGVSFPTAIVARVEIQSGKGAVAVGAVDVTDGGERDLVIMDDFIYGEPQAVTPAERVISAR